MSGQIDRLGAASGSHLPYVVMVLCAGLCFSFVGLLTRLLDSAGGWQVIAFRSLGVFVVVLVFVAVRHRRASVFAFRAIGWRGVLGGVGLAFGSTCYVWALFHTTVANTVLLFGALPFINTMNAWMFLGERPRRDSWFLLSGAFAGLVIIVAGGVAEGRWVGNVIALAGLVGFTTYTIVARHGRQRDMTPALCVSALVAGTIAFLLAGGETISRHDLILCLLMGAGAVGAGYVLYTMASRRVRAGELSLIVNVELVLGPLWVAIVVSELPEITTIIGGTLIIAAVVFQSTVSLRRGD